MLTEKEGILPEWYDGLMGPVQAEELMDVLRDTPRVSAPGADEVSTGVWKVALQGCAELRALVCALFSGCLRASTFPSAWKSSVIVPLVKDPGKERSMQQHPPDQPAELPGQAADEAARAPPQRSSFARHPILNPSQRGFVLGGTTAKCIDELLDAWDVEPRGGRTRAYTLFYDIKQAYDSVQRDVLLRALRRIRLPDSFVALIGDSLTGLSSRVRTVYGLTRSFGVRRSLRQGDPLAPLLFVILMDALHDGLERNPFTEQQHGCALSYGARREVYIPSLGYADDTGVLANSLPNLQVQNQWVLYFMAFNRLRLNHEKCELVGRGPDGKQVTAAALAAHPIIVDGHALQPLAHDHTIRYLGVHTSFDGSWIEQQKKTLNKVRYFARIASKFNLCVRQRVYMFTVFLLPKMELALHYVHGPGTDEWLRACDAALIDSIRRSASSPLQLSHRAVALAVQLNLPSWVETSVKVSELFLRVNSRDLRWGKLGRVLLAEAHPELVIAHPAPRSRQATETLITRTTKLAVSKLQWRLIRHEEQLAGSRRRHLFDAEPITGALVVTDGHCSSSQQVALTDGPAIIAHDAWNEWGAMEAAYTVHAYTDGSYAPGPEGGAVGSTSAWAVVIGDQWLDDNFLSLPSDEQLVRPADVAAGLLFGAGITCTRGVYPAEMPAIARVLAMLPIGCHLHTHSDSQASILALASYRREPKERQRLRMAARPLLQLIDHLTHRREEAGGERQAQPRARAHHRHRYRQRRQPPRGLPSQRSPLTAGRELAPFPAPAAA